MIFGSENDEEVDIKDDYGKIGKIENDSKDRKIHDLENEIKKYQLFSGVLLIGIIILGKKVYFK